MPEGQAVGSHSGSQTVWIRVDSGGRLWTREPVFPACVDAGGQLWTAFGYLRIRRTGPSRSDRSEFSRACDRIPREYGGFCLPGDCRRFGSCDLLGAIPQSGYPGTIELVDEATCGR